MISDNSKRRMNEHESNENGSQCEQKDHEKLEISETTNLKNDDSVKNDGSNLEKRRKSDLEGNSEVLSSVSKQPSSSLSNHKHDMDEARDNGRDGFEEPKEDSK